MLARMGAALADNVHSAYVLHIIHRVRAEVGHFYMTTTLINCGLGPGNWAGHVGLGYAHPLPVGRNGGDPELHTVCRCHHDADGRHDGRNCLFDTIGPVLGVAGSYVVLATIEGQVAQPLLVGRPLEVNPLLILLGLWFGSLFWGIAGIILATPLLVALKVVAENSKSGKPMMEFLGPNNQSSERDVTLKRLVRRNT